jgi:hypothetical protein
MTNPYEPPIQLYQDRSIHTLVRAPALALIVVSSIAIGFGALGLIADVVLLATGVVARMEAMNRGAESEYTLIAIRTIWGVALLIASSFVFYGSVQMRNLKNYGTARAAAIVAMVPLLGPCCILGIPFGIWAFVVLGKPGVRNSFQ